MKNPLLLLLGLGGLGAGYYFFVKKGRGLQFPKLFPSGEIYQPYQPQQLPSVETKSTVITQIDDNKIQIQLKPITKGNMAFVPKPVTFDVNKLFNWIKKPKAVKPKVVKPKVIKKQPPVKKPTKIKKKPVIIPRGKEFQI